MEQNIGEQRCVSLWVGRKLDVWEMSEHILTLQKKYVRPDQRDRRHGRIEIASQLIARLAGTQDGYQACEFVAEDTLGQFLGKLRIFFREQFAQHESMQRFMIEHAVQHVRGVVRKAFAEVAFARFQVLKVVGGIAAGIAQNGHIKLALAAEVMENVGLTHPRFLGDFSHGNRFETVFGEERFSRGDDAKGRFAGNGRGRRVRR